MSWKQPVRVLIHIADAPPHGVKFHAPHLHDTNQTDADGTIMKGLLTQLKSLEINFFFGKILPETDEVFKFDRYCYYDSHLVHLHSIPFLILANPGLFFVYFTFSHQVESNSDRWDPSRPLYPLDHHYGPIPLYTFLNISHI